jgi:AraC-like DNA-binding protein
MSNTPVPAIPLYSIFREPGERTRLVTVDYNDELLPQKKIWLSPHRKDYYLLMFIKTGSGRHWVDMVPYEFKSETLFFSTPEQVHAKDDVRTTGIAICITNDYFQLKQNADLLLLPFMQNMNFSNELILEKDDKNSISELMQHIVTEYEHMEDLQDEMLYAYIRILFIYLARIYNKQHKNADPLQRHELYRRFQAGIENNYKSISEVKTYATMLNISVSHLNAFIKEQSGKTVMMHVHDRQILEAKRLLYNTSMSVKQIAFNLGFKDTSYFNRFFKRITSVTPLDYRNEISE